MSAHTPRPLWQKIQSSVWRLRWALLLLAGLNMSGCAALAVSLVGAGAGAGLSHQVNGVAARTFSEPLPKVMQASLVAAQRMSFEFDATDLRDAGASLTGRVAELDITVDLETLSSTVTRVSVSARKNLLMMDSATAQELVAQIERAIAAQDVAEAERTRQLASSTRRPSAKPVERYEPTNEVRRKVKANPKNKDNGAI